jgi:hypothetical protein
MGGGEILRMILQDQKNFPSSAEKPKMPIPKSKPRDFTEID